MPEPPMMPSTDLVMRAPPLVLSSLQATRTNLAFVSKLPAEIASSRFARLAMTTSVKRRAPFRGPCQHPARYTLKHVPFLTESERALDSLVGAYSYRRTGAHPVSSPGQAFAGICANARSATPASL